MRAVARPLLSAVAMMRHRRSLLTHTSCAAVVAALVAGGAAIGCGGGGAVDDPVPPDAAAGLCEGRPCVTEVPDEATWATISVPYQHARCDLVETSKFIAPARADVPLPQPVFIDVGEQPFHLDFLRDELPAWFGGLTQAQYIALVQARATRGLWAGALYRITDEAGRTEGYGFDVIVDPRSGQEQLTEAEVTAVRELLAAHVELPLVYVPTTTLAIQAAWTFSEEPVSFGRNCSDIPCANGDEICIEVPTAVPVCGQFWEGRSIETEYLHKARVTAEAGALAVSTEPGSYPVPALFGAGEGTPARLAIVPGASATMLIEDVGGSLRATYKQPMTLDGQALELSWELWGVTAGRGFRLAEPSAGAYFGAYLTPVTPGEPWADWALLGSCANADDEAWRVRATFADGGQATIHTRYQPPLAGSGPLFVVGAEVEFAGETRVVTDYFELVYAGMHHNWNNQYWVLWDEPIDVDGELAYGLWFDEAEFTSELDGAYLLGAAQQVLAPISVDTYVVEPDL